MDIELRGIRPIYQGNPILSLEVHDVRLPNGVERQMELIRHPGAAAVVPLGAGGEVILLRQLRYATKGYLIEIPAGKLSPGEAPETCARRELEEETGMRAGRLEPLFPIWMTPGFCDERIWLFLARDLEPGRLALEEDELIEVLRVPFERALAMIEKGEITDAKTICGLAAAALRLKRV
jgi:ADP-ribose pyrophosphatase